MTLLIVDDDAGTRQLLHRVLSRDYADVTVLQAEDGLSALNVITSEHVDFVLLDLNMRGLGGLDTLEAIRRSPSRATLPVVLLSGQADQPRVLRARKLGVEAFLAKPFSIKLLRQRLYPLIDAALGERAAPLDPGTDDRVLVLDSQPGFRTMFRERMSVLCEVDEAGDGLSAFRTCVDHLPAAIFVGVTADPFDPAQFADRLRRVVPHARPRMIAMVAPDHVDVVRASNAYHAVVGRSYTRDTLERALLDVLAPPSKARLLFGNTTRVAMVLEVAATLLSELLDETTTTEALQSFPDSGNRSVWAGMELQSGELAWELRLRWPIEAMLALSSGWSDLLTDELSEVRMLEIARTLAGQLSETLRADMLARGVPTDAGPARTSLGRASGCWFYDSDRTGIGGWIVSPRHHPAMALQLVPLGKPQLKT